ncbi:MAG: RNA ligase (ATP) [Clostridiales Family XIII bacterium]|jgi:RNA ligase (TIGR02306 family)|nr:RNA ligase (ATP) [Clostridiales Family XIII bacterium]
MRTLATIQEIFGIDPIKDSDYLELAHVLGWGCVVKKGTFRVGDRAVYFEVDSFLPVDERYEFLRKTSFRENPDNGAGFRIKTLRLRGQLSQGLLLPLSDFPELEGATLGDDVTEALGIKKWYMPEVGTGSGTAIGGRPHGIPASDETRIQSAPELLSRLRGEPYYITTKMDGTSGIVYCIDGKIGCCSRNYEIKDEVDALYWAAVYKYGLKEKLAALGKNVVLTGEICGPAIQKNKLRLAEYEWYVFDYKDWDTGTYIPYAEMVERCDALGVPTVPLEEDGEAFDYSLEQLLEMAKGKYPSGLEKEGIVVRHKNEPHKISFKVLNNEALLKEKD